MELLGDQAGQPRSLRARSNCRCAQCVLWSVCGGSCQLGSSFSSTQTIFMEFFLAFSDLWCFSLHRGCSHLVYQGHKRSRTLSCRHYPQLHIFECVALWSKHIPGLTFVHLQIYHSQLQPSFLIHITSLVSLVELY